MPSLFDRYLAPGAQPHLDGTETARQPVGLRPEQAVALFGGLGLLAREGGGVARQCCHLWQCVRPDEAAHRLTLRERPSTSDVGRYRTLSQDNWAKSLTKLALPRGLEPLFSP